MKTSLFLRKGFFNLLLTAFFVTTTLSPIYSQNGFTVDHMHTNINDIPDAWITQAKSNLHIAYNHTSHGSQLISGMEALENFPDFNDKYSWVNNSQGTTSDLSLDDHGIGGVSDLSNGDYDSDGDGIADFAEDTYTFLDNTNNYHINVIIWSWCNIAGHDIPLYLNSMEWLINQFGENGLHPRAEDYPVQFVFMTGHANGGGEGDSSDTPNEQIRNFISSNNYILFDFSDIENYDPDNNYFLDKRVDDALYYDNTPPYDSGDRDANWATEYLNNHDNSELDKLTTGDGVSGYNGCGSCAHSPEGGETSDAKLNCILKGSAAWYLFARLAGWNGTLNTDESINNPPILELYQNTPNPFMFSTDIKYKLLEPATLTLEIYNLLGEKIICLLDREKQKTGIHSIPFEASLMGSGIYIYSLKVGDKCFNKKMILFE